jgi:hypothetical protein
VLQAHGGGRLLRTGPDPYAADVLARGDLFDLPVRQRPGEPNRCHANAAELWARDVDRYRPGTGYALTGDVWVTHSWVVDGGRLYEFNGRRERYFGVQLEPDEALRFWMSQLLGDRYPGVLRLINGVAYAAWAAAQAH